MPKTNKELRDEAVALAAECWTDPETEHLTMIPELAEAVAKRLLKLLKRIDNLKGVSEPPTSDGTPTIQQAALAVLGGVGEVSGQYYYNCLERIAEMTGRTLNAKLEEDVATILEFRPAVIDVEQMKSRRERRRAEQETQSVKVVLNDIKTGTIALGPNIPTPTVENLNPPN